MWVEDIVNSAPMPTSSSRTVYPLCFEVMSLYVNYSLCVIFNDFEPPIMNQCRGLN